MPTVQGISNKNCPKPAIDASPWPLQLSAHSKCDHIKSMWSAVHDETSLGFPSKNMVSTNV